MRLSSTFLACDWVLIGPGFTRRMRLSGSPILCTMIGALAGGARVGVSETRSGQMMGGEKSCRDGAEVSATIANEVGTEGAVSSEHGSDRDGDGDKTR
ncbi:hypothetical protein K505DRAFT_38016 [Melanomma pulvis-pyrius CBS 109.77]|uniref:Uncharacterized protein n=1 Tax=Melanomma pulvis-pyrius CBS 109.77 TaxID=1314802 RepID=A0A6A6XBL7_9PLEO|nr:hypothetical protein K505DRAFT_38016 [Melanomma pulvis-pyrius CBS 109.77]